MSYQVLQDGKPCSEYNIPNWGIDTFDTVREAEIFAYLWAYPVTKEEAEVNAPQMAIGCDIDYSMTSECPVLMKIIEKAD